MNALSTTRADLRPRPTAMAEALRNLQQVLEQCRDAVFLANAEGVITRVNPAFERLTGYSSSEIVGKDLSLIIEQGAASPQYQQLWRSLFENKPYDGQQQIRTKSGKSCTIQLIVTPVRGAQLRILSLVGTAVVMAEQEQSILPDSSRVLHDLRNMLLVVIAHAELALDVLPREHPARPHLESSKSAAQNAAALAHEFTQGISSADHVTGKASQGPRTVDHLPSMRQSEGGQEVREEKLATILFVEDESLVLDASTEFLQRAGYNVLSAMTGGDAIELVRSYSGRIDLLITDMVLPQVGGSDLAAAITATHPEVKVLAISGHPEDYVLRQPGIGHCLVKPFTFSDLEEKVRQLLYEKKPACAIGAL